jgi:hypothetical protein
VAINGFHATDVRGTELGQRNAGFALDCARHARGPEQFITQVTVDELVNVAEVLQQLPSLTERRRHEFDERFRKVRRDVFVGERSAQGDGVRRLNDCAIRRHSQGFLLDPLSAAPQYPSFAGVDEPRDPTLELLVNHVTQLTDP